MPGWIIICSRLDLKLARSAVGDRYVLEEMHKGGFNVGGEQSGHIILSDVLHHRRRADCAALQVLAVLAQEAKASPPRRAHLFNPLPQVLENVRFKKGAPLEDAQREILDRGGATRSWARRAACWCASRAPSP